MGLREITTPKLFIFDVPFTDVIAADIAFVQDKTTILHKSIETITSIEYGCRLTIELAPVDLMKIHYNAPAYVQLNFVTSDHKRAVSEMITYFSFREEV